MRFRRLGDLGGPAVAVLGLNGFQIAATFGIQLWMARYLGASEFGAYAYANTWVNYLVQVGTLGLDLAALRLLGEFLARDDRARARGFVRFSGAAVALGASAVAVVFSVGVTVLGPEARTAMRAALYAGAVALPVFSVLTLHEALARALGHVVRGFVPRLVLRPLFFATALAVPILLGWRVRASDAVLLYAGAGALALLVLRRMVGKKVREGPGGDGPAVTEAGVWARLGLSLALVSNLQVVLDQSDIIVAGFFTTGVQIGTYVVVRQMGNLAGFGLAAVNAVVAPRISGLHARGAREELEALSRRSARMALAFAGAALAGGVLLGRPVLGLFGEAFRAGYPALVVVLAAQLVNAWAGPVALLLALTGHQRVVTYVFGGAAVLTFLLESLWVPRYGILGAAAGVATVTCLWNGALVWAVWRRLGIRGTAI